MTLHAIIGMILCIMNQRFHFYDNIFDYNFLEAKNKIEYPIPEGFMSRVKKTQKDIDKLYFPNEITEDIGLSINEITFLKKKGCHFYGRKTTIRWVRVFIATQAGLLDSMPPACHDYLTSNTHHEQLMNYD